MPSFADEQFIVAEKEKRNRTFSTLESGMYVGDELICFQERLLFDGRISVVLPEEFVPLPENIKKVKYPSENRPQIIYTNLQTTVNIGFSWIQQSMTPAQLYETAKATRDVSRRLNPANVYHELQDAKDHEPPYTWLDYKGQVMDGQLYTLVGYYSIEGKCLFATMNCDYGTMLDWKPIFLQILTSLRAVKKN